MSHPTPVTLDSTSFIHHVAITRQTPTAIEAIEQASIKGNTPHRTTTIRHQHRRHRRTPRAHKDPRSPRRRKESHLDRTHLPGIPERSHGHTDLQLLHPHRQQTTRSTTGTNHPRHHHHRPLRIGGRGNTQPAPQGGGAQEEIPEETQEEETPEETREATQEEETQEEETLEATQEEEEAETHQQEEDNPPDNKQSPSRPWRTTHGRPSRPLRRRPHQSRRIHRRSY